MTSICECYDAIIIESDVGHWNAAKTEAHDPLTRSSGGAASEVISSISTPRLIESSNVNPDDLVIAAPLANEFQRDLHGQPAI